MAVKKVIIDSCVMESQQFLLFSIIAICMWPVTVKRTQYNRTLWSLVRVKEGVLGVKVYGSRHPMPKTTWEILGSCDRAS